MITKYGLDGENEIAIELYCFRTNWQQHGGLGRYQHFRRICRMLFPTLAWNPWLELTIETLCDPEKGRVNGITREIVLSGCGAAGKTFGVALFTFVWWLSDSGGSAAFLTSTSAKMVRKRIWPVIQRLYQSASKVGVIGNLLDSQTTLQSVKGDDLQAIFAKAVGQGETTAAANDIQGAHPLRGRVMVVLDEATEVQPAILTAIENLEKGASELIVVKMGNSISRFDCLGEAMTPKNGWASVSVSDEEWETAKGGYCLHFDGFNSPNVKAGSTRHPHIYTWENYQADLKKDQNTLEFWMYVRGFPAPDSVSNAVISEALMMMHNVMGRLHFTMSKVMLAGLDPAFGGDRCVFSLGEMGMVASVGGGADRIGIQLVELIEIDSDPNSSEARDYQIARRVIDLCRSRGVAPSHFGMDSTGTGRGLASIIHELWSGEIKKVEFGGAASKMPASAADPRPSFEVYDRRVTELWYSVREFVCSGQLGGFSKELVNEFGNRRIERTGGDKKVKLETKIEYKKRHGKSPDFGDSVAVLIEVARQLGAQSTGKSAVRAENSWKKLSQSVDSLHVDDNEVDAPKQPQAMERDDFAEYFGLNKQAEQPDLAFDY